MATQKGLSITIEANLPPVIRPLTVDERLAMKVKLDGHQQRFKLRKTPGVFEQKVAGQTHVCLFGAAGLGATSHGNQVKWGDGSTTYF